MKQLFIIGIGPGGAEYLTPQARQALEGCEVVCGYGKYMELAAPLLEGKKQISTPMMHELERCRLALQSAQEGHTTGMICSGDAGVYGMAGPILQISPQFPDVDLQVIPGVTAALAGAALLGAPLMHDFAVLSLSDLLTPWEVIAQRIQCAAQGDFVIVLYNPMSQRRRDHLRRACQIIERERSGDTICGWVRNVGRGQESHQILPLRELKDACVDMFTTVFIGSSSTLQLGDRMVTPRGYEVQHL